MPPRDLNGSIDIFTGKSLNLFDDPLKLLEIDPVLINPIIDQNSMLKNMTLLEHICGRSKKEGYDITVRQIEEISRATVYPPQNRTLPDKQTVLSSMKMLTSMLSGNKSTTSSSGGGQSESLGDLL